MLKGKGRLHFVDDKAKINTDYYVNGLLPKLVEDCETLMPDGYTFQKDDAPSRHVTHRNGWSSRRRTSSTRTSGRPTHLT